MALTRKEALATLLGELEGDIEELGENTFEVDGAEYVVLTEEEAQDFAEDSVKSIYEDLGLESFTPNFQEWVAYNALDEEKLKEFVEDDIEDYYKSKDEYEIAEEAIEKGLLDEDEVYDEFGSLKSKVRETIPDLRQQLIDLMIEEYKDPYEYCEMVLGSKWYKDYIDIDDFVDLDKVAEEAVSEDGRGHFISSYDGKEEEIDEWFIYRID